jgi:hypothetical protein
MDKRYAKQIIEWAEEAKETLTIRKEIIIDNSVNNEQLGIIIRQMYKAKVEAQDEQIKHTKQNTSATNGKQLLFNGDRWPYYSNRSTTDSACKHRTDVGTWSDSYGNLGLDTGSYCVWLQWNQQTVWQL